MSDSSRFFYFASNTKIAPNQARIETQKSKLNRKLFFSNYFFEGLHSGKRRRLWSAVIVRRWRHGLGRLRSISL